MLLSTPYELTISQYNSTSNIGGKEHSVLMRLYVMVRNLDMTFHKV